MRGRGPARRASLASGSFSANLFSPPQLPGRSLLRRPVLPHRRIRRHRADRHRSEVRRFRKASREARADPPSFRRIFAIIYNTFGIISFAVCVGFLRATVLESVQRRYQRREKAIVERVKERRRIRHLLRRSYGSDTPPRPRGEREHSPAVEEPASSSPMVDGADAQGAEVGQSCDLQGQGDVPELQVEISDLVSERRSEFRSEVSRRALVFSFVTPTSPLVPVFRSSSPFSSSS